MDIFIEIDLPQWDGDWDGAYPKPDLPDPDPDPWPNAVLAAEDLVHELHAAPEVLPEVGEAGLWPFVEEFEAELKDLESEDKLGNFEIQRLMQIMNQNDTLEANVREKTNDTANAIIGKI
jgi:hypothetical protein